VVVSVDAYARARADESPLEDFGLPSLEHLHSESFPKRRLGLKEIDRAVRGYHRKLAGLDPWPVFELPPSLRETERRAA